MKYQILIISVLYCVAKAFKATDPLNTINDITSDMQNYLSIDFDFEYYSGYVSVQEDTSLFFTAVTKQGETLAQTSSDTPVIFWFNGGPGCSSQYGNWVEIGPFKLDSDLNASENNFSWNQYALLIFIDQPINAGYSYSGDQNVVITNTSQATATFKTFIQAFYETEQFSGLIDNKTYFFGESYAGHYIPNFAKMMMEDQPVQGLNFQGVGIGDGWTDPYYQMGSMADFFFNTSVVGGAQRAQIQKTQEEGQAEILEKNYAEATHIFDSLTDDTAQYGEIDQYNLNYYNIEGQEDPYTQQYFVDLYNDESFRDILGVPEYVPKFSNCNDTIYVDFNNDFTVSYKEDVEQILENGLKVMLFNGNLDIIVNTAGAQDWINTMQWSHLQKWQYTDKEIFHLYPNSDAVIGNYQQYDNFVFVNIYNAGHMVPSDQPNSASVMLQTYLAWEW